MVLPRKGVENDLKSTIGRILGATDKDLHLDFEWLLTTDQKRDPWDPCRKSGEIIKQIVSSRIVWNLILKGFNMCRHPQKDGINVPYRFDDRPTIFYFSQQLHSLMFTFSECSRVEIGLQALWCRPQLFQCNLWFIALRPPS